MSSGPLAHRSPLDHNPRLSKGFMKPASAPQRPDSPAEISGCSHSSLQFKTCRPSSLRYVALPLVKKKLKPCPSKPKKQASELDDPSRSIGKLNHSPPAPSEEPVDRYLLRPRCSTDGVEPVLFAQTKACFGLQISSRVAFLTASKAPFALPCVFHLRVSLHSIFP